MLELVPVNQQPVAGEREANLVLKKGQQDRLSLKVSEKLVPEQMEPETE